jgi:hypothetical protein
LLLLLLLLLLLTLSESDFRFLETEPDAVAVEPMNLEIEPSTLLPLLPLLPPAPDTTLPSCGGGGELDESNATHSIVATLDMQPSRIGDLRAGIR